MRRAIPTVVPLQDMDAEAFHRAGMSCVTHPIYNFDANGHRRWCSDCGAELGEASWHPNGADISNRALGAVIVATALLVAIMAFILVGLNVRTDDDPGPAVTPATYGHPTVCVKVEGC